MKTKGYICLFFGLLIVTQLLASTATTDNNSKSSSTNNKSTLTSAQKAANILTHLVNSLNDIRTQYCLTGLDISTDLSTDAFNQIQTCNAPISKAGYIFFIRDDKTNATFSQWILEPINSWQSTAATWQCSTDTCKSTDTTTCDPFRQIINSETTQVGCSAVKCTVGTNYQFLFACAFDKVVNKSPDPNLLLPSGKCDCLTANASPRDNQGVSVSASPQPGGEPMQSFTIKFGLSSDIATFDSSAQQQFINNIANILQIPASQATMVSITAGSVYATVQITATQTQVNNLNQNSLSTLGVVNYSVTNNSANAPFYQSTLFIVLISISVVVVAAIIVAIIVIVGLRKRAHKERERMEGASDSLLGEVDDDQLMNYITQDIY